MCLADEYVPPSVDQRKLARRLLAHMPSSQRNSNTCTPLDDWTPNESALLAGDDDNNGDDVLLTIGSSAACVVFVDAANHGVSSPGPAAAMIRTVDLFLHKAMEFAPLHVNEKQQFHANCVKRADILKAD
jgi:hypothetical protein